MGRCSRNFRGYDTSSWNWEYPKNFKKEEESKEAQEVCRISEEAYTFVEAWNIKCDGSKFFWSIVLYMKFPMNESRDFGEVSVLSLMNKNSGWMARV